MSLRHVWQNKLQLDLAVLWGHGLDFNQSQLCSCSTHCSTAKKACMSSVQLYKFDHESLKTCIARDCNQQAAMPHL